jgi:hypothetical protein
MVAACTSWFSTSLAGAAGSRVTIPAAEMHPSSFAVYAPMDAAACRPSAPAQQNGHTQQARHLSVHFISSTRQHYCHAATAHGPAGTVPISSCVAILRICTLQHPSAVQGQDAPALTAPGEPLATMMAQE